MGGVATDSSVQTWLFRLNLGRDACSRLPFFSSFSRSRFPRFSLPELIMIIMQVAKIWQLKFIENNREGR